MDVGGPTVRSFISPAGCVRCVRRRSVWSSGRKSREVLSVVWEWINTFQNIKKRQITQVVRIWDICKPYVSTVCTSAVRWLTCVHTGPIHLPEQHAKKLSINHIGLALTSHQLCIKWINSRNKSKWMAHSFWSRRQNLITVPRLANIDSIENWPFMQNGLSMLSRALWYFLFAKFFQWQLENLISWKCDSRRQQRVHGMIIY